MQKNPDIQGQALLDYYLGKEDVPLILHTSYGPPEEMPVEVFFREREDFSRLENFALQFCRGAVLDVGAGAGSFALELQEEGLPVTALEISPLCCQIMRHRGLEKVVEHDFWQFEGEQFDTLLLMMNGIGLAGKVERLCVFLEKLKSLLKPDGQIICDSSDISYLYGRGKKPADRYFGEISYCYEYEEEQGEWFPWLYADPVLLNETAKLAGLQMKMLYKSKTDQFLAKLSL